MRYTDYHEINIHQATLRKCSYDAAHNEYMTLSELPVINFDDVKTDYLNHRGYTEEKAHSVDAIVNGPDQLLYMIEFKNGDIKKERKSIQLKVRDSILLICDICKRSISYTRKEVVFVLVYNEERSHLDWETKRMLRFVNCSGHSIPFMDLDKIEGFIVRKVHMLTVKQFEERLLPKLQGI